MGFRLVPRGGQGGAVWLAISLAAPCIPRRLHAMLRPFTVWQPIMTTKPFGTLALARDLEAAGLLFAALKLWP